MHVNYFFSGISKSGGKQSEETESRLLSVGQAQTVQAATICISLFVYFLVLINHMNNYWCFVFKYI